MGTDTLQRMIDELKALHEKLEKLRAFIDNKEEFEKLDYLNRDLLISQFKAMETYLSILSVRIGLNAPKQTEGEEVVENTESEEQNEKD